MYVCLTCRDYDLVDLWWDTGRSAVSNSVTPWTAACQASLSFSISWNLLKLMSIELVMPSNHLVICCPLLLLPSIFPSIRVFFNQSALCIRWPKYWSSASASVLLMNIRDWFPLGLTGLISLHSDGTSSFFLSFLFFTFCCYCMWQWYRRSDKSSGIC